MSNPSEKTSFQFRLSKNSEDLLGALETLKKAKFKEMFGSLLNERKWSTKVLGLVAPVTSSKKLADGKVWLLNLDQIEANTGKILSYSYVNKGNILGRSVCQFDSNHVLYSKLRPYLNKVVVPMKGGYCTSELLTLEPNPLVLKRDFLAFILRSDFFVQFISNKVVGSKMPRVSMPTFNSFEIILPPLELQQNFIDFLNQIEKIQRILQSILDKLVLLKKSKFKEMFGEINLSSQSSEWEKIKDIGEVISGATPKTSNDEYWNGTYKWITPAEIGKDAFWVERTERTLTRSGIESKHLRLLPKGTVLLTSRAPIGKVALANCEMCSNQGFKNIVCSKKIEPVFLYFLLKNNSSYLNGLGRGATFKEISKEIVENIKIPVPPISKQSIFVELIKHIEGIKQTLQKSLYDLTGEA